MLFRTRARRRRRAAAEPFPPEWRDLLARRWATWAELDDAERAVVERHTALFLADVRFEGARPFEVTDEVRVLVAAQAALLLVGLDPDAEQDLYRSVTTVIVHRSTVVLGGVRATDVPGVVAEGDVWLSGEAHHRRGPVVLSWRAVRSEARHPARGMNVVLHEFAHKLDMLDGTVDGTPPLLPGEQRERWVRVCTREYRRLRAGLTGPILRGYGGTDPGEFFAVVTEVFFTRPLQLREELPELYEVFAAFYRQDPAERALRSAR